MAVPYLPTQLATAIVNPAVGSIGSAPLPYLSNSQYQYAPTAMDAKNLLPGGTTPQSAQVLVDTIRRASGWVNEFCFGADPAVKGASLAASLSVETVYAKVISGELRLVCDYRPIVQVTGIDIGIDPSTTQSVGPVVASQSRIGRRTIYVPIWGVAISGRPNDIAPGFPNYPGGGRMYVVWSYVNGYPHTALAVDVAADATSCVVQSTDGNGGVWGLYPGASLTVVDPLSNTEVVTVLEITPGSTTTTLGTTAFTYEHTLPTAPDFIPVTGIPDAVQQAAISATTMLIKTRGNRAMVMPSAAGGQPNGKALAQAGAFNDWSIACKLLKAYRVHAKVKT